MMRYPILRPVVLGIIVILSLPQSTAATDFYKLEGVKRVDDDLYKTSRNLYIQTINCFHYTFGEDAVLKWEGVYGENKIIWADDSNCRVKTTWSK